tara:strand:+ start:1341 stop:1568 length:228 start_codon:yes stop_codon:yes gene_type:complete
VERDTKPSRVAKMGKPLSAFEDGMRGFTNNRANPFKSQTSHPAKEWERGYNKAYFSNLTKVKEKERIRTTEAEYC